MERPDLEHDPRFATSTDRAANREALREIVEGWLAAFPDNDAAFAVLERHRVPSAPVLSPAEAMEHEYFRARGTVRTVVDPFLGAFPIPGFPLRFSAQPELPDLVAPVLGEHNADILGRVLGYDEARIAALAA